MQKRPLRAAARLATVLAVLACSVVPARAGYFDDFYACDATYFNTLGDCRNQPTYPTNPDEGQCRFNSGDAYVTCLDSIIWGPMPQLDFCDQARAARDNCYFNYQLDGDFDTWSVCWNATGISSCE